MTLRRARRITSLFATFLLSGSLAALLILSGCATTTRQSSVAAVSASEATLIRRAAPVGFYQQGGDSFDRAHAGVIHFG